MKLPLDGKQTASAIISGLDSPRDIAVDGEHIYWVSYAGGQVMRSSPDGDSLVTLASDQDRPRNLVVDATSVYWITGDGPEANSVMKLTPK